MLLELIETLNRKQRSEFVMTLMSMELIHLDRIKEEVNWFTLKFDYRPGCSMEELTDAIQEV